MTWFRVEVGDPLIEVDPTADVTRRFRERYGDHPPQARLVTRLESVGGLHCRAVAYLSPDAWALAEELGALEVEVQNLL